MALGVLLISYAVILILAINIVVLLFIKNGIMAKNNVVYGIIVIIMLILSFVIWSSMPDNYILKKALAIIAGFFILLSIYFKKNNFNIARALISISIVINIYFMIF